MTVVPGCTPGHDLADHSLDVGCDILDVRNNVLDVGCNAVELDAEAAEVVEDLVVLLDHLQLQGVGVCATAARPQPLMASVGSLRAHLQPDLQDFDEPADLVGDLGARRAELVCADDLKVTRRVRCKEQKAPRSAKSGRGGVNE